MYLIKEVRLNLALLKNVEYVTIYAELTLRNKYICRLCILRVQDPKIGVVCHKIYALFRFFELLQKMWKGLRCVEVEPFFQNSIIRLASIAEIASFYFYLYIVEVLIAKLPSYRKNWRHNWAQYLAFLILFIGWVQIQMADFPI